MWSDNETSEDLLGFKVHADLLVDVINDEQVLPVTIGVFGDWGSGKSSILKILHEQLKGDEENLKDDTLVLYFNGWIFEGYDDAKAALLESIIKAFEDNKKVFAHVKDETLKLMRSVNWMRVLSLGFKKIAIPAATAYLTGGVSLIPHLAQQLGGVDAAQLAEKLKGDEGEAFLKSLLKDRPEEEESTLIREFRNDFQSMIEKSTIKKLVVIIDDLDRCTPDRIIENLEAIKLFLNVEKTAFVIGADPRIVRHAIEYRYKTLGKVDEDRNSRIIDDYLEKLIQIPYYLPKLSDTEVETYISLLICKRDFAGSCFPNIHSNYQEFRKKDKYSVFGLANIKESVSVDEHEKLEKSLISIPALVPVITQTLKGNPRQIKRFLNTLVLRQRLAAVANVSDFSEAILAKLMVLEYSDLPLFKQLYDWQVQQKGVPKELETLETFSKDLSPQNAKAEIEKEQNTKGWAKDRIIDWLRVEPSLANVNLSDYFWLSRDKIASTIPGSSLIPPIVRALYLELDKDNLPDAVSKKFIREKVSGMPELEKNSFINYCNQVLIRNQKKKRCYDIFHLLLDEGISEAEKAYSDALFKVPLSNMPIAVGQSLKRFKDLPLIKDFINDKLIQSDSPVARSYKS